MGRVTAALVNLALVLFGIALGALKWRTPLTFVKESRDFARHDLATARAEARDVYASGQQDGARDAVREDRWRIYDGLCALPRLRCSEEGHVRFADLYAVVYDTPVTVKRRRVKESRGGVLLASAQVATLGIPMNDPLAQRSEDGEGREE